MAEGAQVAEAARSAQELEKEGSAVDGTPEEVEVRCKACNKFLTKLIVTVDVLAARRCGNCQKVVPHGAKRKVVKVGFETRCPRCKEFVYHLFVA